MSLDRTKVPPVRRMEQFAIQIPEERTLRNGIPLHVFNVGTEEVIRLDVVMTAGAWRQHVPLQAMLTNRMLREGTRSLDANAIAERLDYYGAWLDLSSSVTHGFITLYTLKKYFPQTLDLLAQIVREPVFPEKELSVVVDVNRQHFLVNSQRVDVMARKQFNRSLFGAGHPLGKYAELRDYDTIKADDLKSFYRTYYHSANCSIYVSGKVTPDVIAGIEHSFGDEPWGNTQRPTGVLPHFEINTDERKHIFIEKEDAMQSSIKVGKLSLEQHHPDFLDFRVAVTLFGGYFGSRLMANIREQKGYTYGIGACVINYPGLGVLGISTEAANEYVTPVLEEIKKEIDILQTEKVPDKELDMVRNYMLGDFCRTYESAFSLSDAWIYLHTFGLEADFYEKAIRSIMQVTKEDILRLAQQYLDKKDLTVVVAGRKKE